MREQTSYAEFIKYVRSIISFYENEYKCIDIKRDIDVLENKIDDKNLYLGVVGSFSSGKSTFINSVIHKNLLPTDAVQGTTVATSILKRADYDDLEITYLDGESKRYSQCADELLEEYQIQSSFIDSDEEKELTIWERFVKWIRCLLGINASKKKAYPNINDQMELFKKIISTENIAQNIQYVTLYYKNNNIPYNIAMVDTPGTESLNKRHNDVTKNAIDNICDAIVVMIPYDEPVSQELLNYVNTHLEQQKEDCIFVVTKIELLGDKEELPRLMRVIKNRLEKGLEIENASVIPMPTFIYLKSVDSEMQTTFLDNIPEAEREELIQMYEEGMALINSILSTKRTKYINNKIIDICERVVAKLRLNLLDIVNDYEEKNRKLENNSVMMIDSFENKAMTAIKDIDERYQQRIYGEMGFVNISLSSFRSEIKRVIDNSNDSQNLYNRLNFNLYNVFYDINLATTSLLEKLNEGINLKLHNLGEEFKREYEQCDVKCEIEDITIDPEGFYNEEFKRECESILQDGVKYVKYSIKNDTNGILKKVKALFYDLFSKHKDLALSELSSTVDKLNQKIADYTIEHMKEKLTKANVDAEKSVQHMLDYDRQIINEYINITNQSINSNIKNKELTQAHINRLNEYMMLMKEVNYGKNNGINKNSRGIEEN